jgi:hypothetical protein
MIQINLVQTSLLPICKLKLVKKTVLLQLCYFYVLLCNLANKKCNVKMFS